MSNDPNHVPESLRWLVPIAEALLQKQEANAEIALSNDHTAEFRQRFTREERQELEDWLDRDESDASQRMSMAMILLDELGELDDTEPTLDYQRWLANFEKYTWGARSGAARIIGDDYLDGLSAEQRDSLKLLMQTKLSDEQNPNCRIWFNWLLCRMDDRPAERVAEIERLTFLSTTEDSERFDTLTDGCWALLSLEAYRPDSYAPFEGQIFAKEIDPSEAACILEQLLESPYVPRDVKQRFRDLASASGVEELIEVLEELDEGNPSQA